MDKELQQLTLTEDRGGWGLGNWRGGRRKQLRRLWLVPCGASTLWRITWQRFGGLRRESRSKRWDRDGISSSSTMSWIAIVLWKEGHGSVAGGCNSNSSSFIPYCVLGTSDLSFFIIIQNKPQMIIKQKKNYPQMVIWPKETFVENIQQRIISCCTSLWFCVNVLTFDGCGLYFRPCEKTVRAQLPEPQTESMKKL